MICSANGSPLTAIEDLDKPSVDLITGGSETAP